MSQSKPTKTLGCTRKLARLLSCGAVALVLHRAAAASDPTVSGPAAPRASYSALVYDSEYPFIDYSGKPSHNDIARLQARLLGGAAHLEYRAPRGYLDSLLAALRIDPSSQTLVFSKTSLQVQQISAATPRAVYFNDDTYVAYVQGGAIEIATMDSVMGPVFYTLPNEEAAAAHFERETLRCLSCHDSFSLTGGGVPNFLFLSAYTRHDSQVVTNTVATPTTDATPLRDRWGGWYVTGQSGRLAHLGNILPAESQRQARRVTVLPPDLDSLAGFFDTRPYVTDKSDIVALLVFEHQVYVHNLIAHANYKARMLMERERPGSSSVDVSWQQLSSLTQTRMKSLLEPLISAMLFIDAAPLTTRIHGSAGFESAFQTRGPRDPLGRSLRDLDLHTRLFKYPLSFLIYSQGFDYLPACAKQYVYARLAQILSAPDPNSKYTRGSGAERRAILEILTATKPEFAQAVGSARSIG